MPEPSRGTFGYAGRTHRHGASVGEILGEPRWPDDYRADEPHPFIDELDSNGCCVTCGEYSDDPRHERWAGLVVDLLDAPSRTHWYKPSVVNPRRCTECGADPNDPLHYFPDERADVHIAKYGQPRDPESGPRGLFQIHTGRWPREEEGMAQDRDIVGVTRSAERDRGVISQESDKIAEELGALHTSLQELGAALAPVLRPEPNVEGGAAAEPQEIAVGRLALDLRRSREGLAEGRGVVNELIRRLEV